MNYPIDQDLFYSYSQTPAQQPQEATAAYECGGLPDPNEPLEAIPLVHPPDFRPFFTLVSDPLTGEHCHPTIHYLFSDDEDGELLTGAALASLSETGIENPRQREGVEEDEARTHDEDEADENEIVEERVVIVDVAPNGKEVTNVASLSGKWQAVRTEVGAAPSMAAAETGEAGERGLMLRISGQQAGRIEGGRGGELEGLAGRFGEVVGGLERVVGREDGEGGSEG